MENQKLLSEGNLKFIKEVIQLELLKRGITAPIVIIEETINNNRHRIELETSEFQTTPVIFKTLKIIGWNTSVEIKPKSELKPDAIGNYILVWIPIYYTYTHFGVGSNSTEIFTLLFNVFGSNNDDVRLKSIR